MVAALGEAFPSYDVRLFSDRNTTLMGCFECQVRLCIYMHVSLCFYILLTISTQP